ncbi:hypothetical protein CEQ90_16270 [Lewinellaceae bacterium SD302]|nr:hypothetical protein CEQ90_16270 [Lewinellaceae bacterium SD302]
MKGFYSLLVGALLLFSTALTAQTPLSVSLESASASVGQQVCLDVTGDDFDDVGGFQFSINYDPVVLEWISGMGQTLVGQPVFIIHNDPGDVRVTWNTFSASGIVENDPFLIAEICFTVLQEVETDVVFSNDPLPIEFSEINGASIPDFETNNGVVNEGIGGGNPTCDDGIQNGNETGVDCGGPDCAPCMVMPTCNDGIQNGSETGVDCGGPDCAPCDPVNEDDLIFSMSSTSGNVGDEVCLDIITQNFNGIGGFQYTINYDPTVLEFTQASNQVFFDLSVVQPGANPGEIRVSWNYFQPDEIGETLPDNTLMFTICFTVLQNTGTNVVFSGNPIGIEGFDAAGNELNVILNPGTVNGGGVSTCDDNIQNGNETGVDCGGPDCAPCMVMPSCNDGIQNQGETGIDCGGPNCAPCQMSENCGEGSSNLTFCVENVCVDPVAGETACVSINTTNFTDVAGFEFRVNYAAGNLEYTSYTANSALLSAEQVASNNDGQLVVTWTDPTVEFQGVSLPPEAELFEFCFVTENTASTTINLSLVTAGTVTGANISPIDLTTGSVNAPACFGGSSCTDGIQNGSETGIDCGGPDCAPCMTQTMCEVNGSDLTICIEDVCDAEVGDQVCLDFDVTNFTLITGFQFNITYPAANLEFDSDASSSNSNLLSPVSLNSSSDGTITALWFDPDPNFNGQTIPGTEPLVNICFTVQSTATSLVTMEETSFNDAGGDVPLTLFDGSINGPGCGGVTSNCFDGIQNGNETGVDCGGPDCQPCMTEPECEVNGSDLTICIEDVCDAEVGDQVCLDFDVTNFTLITGFQFNITYPAANLEFDSDASSSNSNLLSPVSLNSSSDGTITALWFDPDPNFNGQTIPGTEPLVNICFTVQSTATSLVTMEETSFNDAGGDVPLTLFDGSINGPGCGGVTPNCFDGIQNGNETGVDCGGPDCQPCMTEPECEVNGSDLTICIEDVCDAEVGDQVCLDFDVTNFTLITGFQFNITYPAANLEFDSDASSSNSNLLSPVSLNSSSDGTITALWFDPDPNFNGQTIPGTEPLVNICFTVQSTATSLVTMEETSFNDAGGDVPLTLFDGSINGPGCGGVTPNCFDGIQNGNETGVDCGGPDCVPCATCNDGIQNGNETGVDCGGPDCQPCMTEPMCEVNGDELTLCIEEVCGDVGDIVCLDFDVTNFTLITGFQFDIIYPAANLEFVPGQSSSNSNLLSPVSFNSSTDGEITSLWFDPNPLFEGQTIPGTEALVTICFEIETAASSTITIVDESFNDEGGDVPLTLFEGSVNGPGCGTQPECNFNGVMDGLETGVDCGGPLCPPCTSGQEDLTLNVSSASVNVGDQACLDVTVENFTNMRVLDLTLNFNSTNLQVASIITTNQLPGLDINDFTIDQAGGTINLNWTGNVGAALADGTILFTVCYNTLTEAVTNVQFDGGSSGLDGDGNQVTLLLNNGTVTAVNNFENLTFVMASGSGPEGSQVCLDILAYNFTDVTAFSFTINYDPLILSFDEIVSNPDFPPGGGFTFNEVSPGEVTVLWQYLPPDFNGITADDGDSPGEVCFTVIEACETEVEFTDSGTDITATDNNGMTLDVDTVDGFVNAGTPCDGGMNPDNLIIDITNANGLAGEEVCVDFIVTNFTGLDELSFTINYENENVSFSGVENFGLGSIAPSNFTVGPLGTITFEWESPSDLGQTIASGGTLFSLCFTVNEVTPTPVNFAATPVPIQARNAAGSNVGVVPSNGMINANAPTGDDLTLVMCCIDGEVGDIVEVPIKVYNFDGVTGFQFGVSYDPASLDFLGATDEEALPFIFTSNPNPGDIRVSWTESGGGCVDLVDGTILMVLEFEILSLDAATVAFSSSPFPIEVLSCDNQLIDTEVVNCAINGDGMPTVVDIIITQPTCHDDTDGSIELVVTGPTNLSYNWNPNPNGDTGPTLTGVGPGTYTFQVVNNDTGESTMGSATIPAGDELFVNTVAVEDITCTDEEDGSIQINPNGGIGTNYTIDWSGNLQDNVLQQLGLDAGTYGVTVIDENGCEVSESYTINEPPPLTFIGSVTDIGDTPGAININITSPGTPGSGYNFSWTGPEAFTANTQNLSGLTVPGTYCLVMLDGNGCPASQCFTVEESLNGFVQVTQACFGELGSIDLTVSGGEMNDYTFNWSGPGGFMADTEDIDGLQPGNYSVTVTSGGNMIVIGATLEAAIAITSSAAVTPATDGNNGEIDLTPAGGQPPYSYLWSNDETTQDLTNLEAGEYCVTITDSQGCENSDSCYVVEDDVIVDLPVLVSIEAVPTNCSDSDDGQATIVLMGGQGPYMATTMPGGISATSVNDSIVFTDLAPGNYTFDVNDNLGNPVLPPPTVTVTAPTAITLDMISLVSDADDGACAGSITIMPVGGTGSYDYEWNIIGVDGPQISGLCAGEYAVILTDENACVFEFGPFTIEQITASGETTDVACEGDESGSIDLTVDGGAEPFTFAWRLMGSSTVFATSEDVEDLAAGVYEVTITDETGASLTEQFTIGTSLGFSFSATVTSNFNGSQVSCSGAADGSARVDVSGLGNFSYEWFDADGNLVGVDSVISGLEAGTYSYMILSDDGCEDGGEVVITEPTRLDVVANVVSVSCFNERDGVISLDVSGGTVAGNYSYEWSNGGSLSQIQFLLEGDYSVVVTDDNGCSIQRTYEVEGPPELVATVESTDANDGCNGTVTVIPLTTGAANFNYRWLQLPDQGNNPVAQNLCPGDYIIEVFDENRCQTITVTATVRDRRFPCLSERNVITPNGDGLNESFILFCTDGGEVTSNTLEIYNRWGQLVYQVNDYNCSTDGGLNCFEGRTNGGDILPAGPYYYVLDYTNPIGEVQQKRGSLTIVLE